jgi:hypothetical protein
MADFSDACHPIGVFIHTDAYMQHHSILHKLRAESHSMFLLLCINRIKLSLCSRACDRQSGRGRGEKVREIDTSY